MSVSSAVPSLAFTASGVTSPTEDEILAGAQSDNNTAFGGNLGSGLNTPQGQLATSRTAIIADKNSQITNLVNMIDPQYATGRFQDAIGRYYFMTRKAATSTSVICTLIGLAGTVVPAGTYAKDTNSNVYSLTSDATIGSNGQITGTVWKNVTSGPIACPAGTLIKVYQTVTGWDAITNPADGTPGTVVESRAEFEYRRKNSVAINSHGTVQAIQAQVFQTAGVTDCVVWENVKAVVVNKGSTNYPMAPHSVMVSAIGGTDTDIAAAMFAKKDGGCDMNGNTSVVVEDTLNYSAPYPSYEYLFERPVALPIYFIVTILTRSGLPSNIDDLIKAAIVARFNGSDSVGTPERIAGTILATRYYTAVAGTDSALLLSSITLSLDGTTYAASVTAGIDQHPTITTANISVVTA